jgi:hypothetical protein
MFSLLFFLGVLIAGLVTHIARLRAEIAQANLRNEDLERLLADLADRMERL